MEKLTKIYEEVNGSLYRNNVRYGWIFDRKDNYYVIERTCGGVELVKVRYIYG
jgi:hypothetical protein